MRYLRKVNEKYSFLKIVLYAILFNGFLFFLKPLLNEDPFSNDIFTTIFLITLGIAFVLKMIDIKIWSFFKFKTVATIDFILFFSLFSELIYIVLCFIFMPFYQNIVFLLLCLTTCLIICRMRLIESLSLNEKTNYNSYLLSTLYKENENSLVENASIVLSDNAIEKSSDDLLNLHPFVECIAQNILLCDSEKTFVMALIGEWGSGKTSVINLLKEKINRKDNKYCNNVIIDVFSLWKFETKESLFEGFYDYISALLGDNFSFRGFNNFIKVFRNVIFGAIQSKFDISFSAIFNINEEKRIADIKSQINEIIKCSNKKIVIVLDDLDRISREEVKFVFNLVNNIFNFDHIIYILCYDELYINKVFDKELSVDHNFIDKIVQSKIYMPIKNKKRMIDIASTSLEHLFEVNHLEISERDRYNRMVQAMFSQCNNLREIVRFFNSFSMSLKILDILSLDTLDFVALQFIKFKNLRVFGEIYKNSELFISEDRWNDSDCQNNPILFEKNIKTSLDNLFQPNSDILKFKDLLATLFPSVNAFSNDSMISLSTSSDKYLMGRRCYNGRFFRVYFTFEYSTYFKLDNSVDEFILKINNNYDITLSLEQLNLSDNELPLFYELLILKRKQITNNKALFDYVLQDILNMQLNNNMPISNERTLLIYIIKNENNISKQKKYLNIIFKKSLRLFEFIVSNLKLDNDKSSKKLFEYGNKLLQNKVHSIINGNVFNLKDSREYFWILYRNTNIQTFKKYIDSLLDETNIYKCLGMFVVQAANYLNDGLIYYQFDEQQFQKLISLDKLKKISSNSGDSLTKDQKMILEVYQNPDKEMKFNRKINFENL